MAERVPATTRIVFADRAQACRALAGEIAALLAKRPDAVLGLPTGSTPVPLYRELIRLHREQGLSFAGARCFNLDEYLGLAPGDPRSFRSWMHEHFFDAVDLLAANRHVPPCDVPAERAAEAAERYGRELADAGGLDLAVLGIGRNGHVGFNEPGSAPDSRTRVVELDGSTRAHATAAFGGLEHVPRRAITLGIADLLQARSIRLLAFGGEKAGIVRRLLQERPGPGLPASLLLGHPDLQLLVDAEAA